MLRFNFTIIFAIFLHSLLWSQAVPNCRDINASLDANGMINLSVVDLVTNSASLDTATVTITNNLNVVLFGPARVAIDSVIMIPGCKYIDQDIKVNIKNDFGACWSSLTVKKIIGPLVQGRLFDVYCYDSIVTAPLTAPLAVDPCGASGFATYVADWLYPKDCMPGVQDTAKIIYREWEAYSKDGIRSIGYDTIVVFLLPQITTTSIYCVDKDSIYCSNLDSLVGPYITLPETPLGTTCMDLPLINITDEDEDGILEFSSYIFDELCGLNTHIDYEIFEVDCSKQYKITIDIKQSCYGAGQTICTVPTPAGMDPNIAEELAPGYWRCEFWLIDFDTLPPELHCKYPILFKGEFDIDNWFADIEGDGSIDTAWAPYEISLTGNNNGSPDLNTDYCLFVTKDTVLAFAYEYRSGNSNAGYDPFGYILNDSFYQLTIGERGMAEGDIYQNGYKIVELRAGDLFCFSQQSSDGTLGSATTTIKQLPIVPTSTHDCIAHTYIPPVQVVDDWSGVKNVKASIPGIGTYVLTYNAEDACYESHQRAALPHRPEPYIIAYEAQDSCHNTIFDTCYILVKDAVRPTAVVDKGITVSLSDKKVWIDAEDFDEGSFDNCKVNLLLVRRQDWYESCIDLCDSMEYICVDEHNDTLWKPVLETDKLIDQVEAHYSENLKWWKEDKEPCTNIIYNAWMYDLIRRGTANCKPHPYEYSNEDVRDLMENCLPAVMDYFVPVSLHPDPFKEGQEIAEQEDFKVDRRLLNTYEQIGGGWSDAVAIDCEDACGSVIVEILVMDYWCNWSTAWTEVWVEDKVPATVVQDVQDIDITCKIFKTEQYVLEGQKDPLSIASIIELAKEKDAVALGALDSIFGGYKKVWKGPYGNYLTADGKIVEDIPFVDSSCYCEIDTIIQTRVYDEHLGYDWKKDTIYDCGYDEVVDTFQHGLVLANCSQFVECDQELWAEIDHCGEGYIYRKFKIWQGCPAAWYANGSVPDSLKSYHLPDTIYRTQRIRVYNECGLEKQMFDVPKDQEIVACGIQYDADGSGNVAGDAHPDQTGWLQYRFDDDCRLVGIGYEDQVFKIVGGTEACYKILRTWYYMDWCEGQPLTDHWYDDPTLDIDSCVQRIFLIDTLAPICQITGPVMDGDTVEVSDCLYDFTAEVEMSDPCGVTTYLYELYEISDLEKVDLVDFHQSPKLKNAETAFAVNIEDLKVGNYKLKVIVTDACGNDGECFYYFTTKAVKKPTAISITSITARLNPMDLDQDGSVDTALVTLWAREYDRSSRVACADSLLEFRIELVDGIGDDTWEDDLDSIELGCPDVGTSIVRLWVISWPSGTADYNDVVAVIQSNVGCDAPLAGKPVSVMDFIEELTNRPIQTKRPDGKGSFDGVDFPARVADENDLSIGEFELMQNYPNPFEAETRIGFMLPENMQAELLIFNINGQRIKSIKGDFVKGLNTVAVSSDLFSVGGIYYYQLNTSGYQSTKRMVFIK